VNFAKGKNLFGYLADMNEVIAGTIIISLLHALIPSHWLPLVTLARLQNWTQRETMRLSFYLALSHVLSTILLGLLLGWVFHRISNQYQSLLELVGPILLICAGLYFLYRHHTHHHFHIDAQILEQTRTKKQIAYALLAYMFLAPCLEIEAYFINAGMIGPSLLVLCVACYALISIAGMVVWVYLALKGIQQFDTHRLEHYAGMITGLTMVFTGLFGLLTGHA